MIGLCYLLSFVCNKHKSKPILFFSIIVLISPLIVYKYFLASLPLGISFFSFQALSYLIDVYQEKISFEKNPINLIIYLSLFIVISSGPILRFSDIKNSLNKTDPSLTTIENGLCRFSIGLFKKVIIADNIVKIVDTVFEMNVHLIPVNLAWVGAIAYMVQIYYDFSGYSDMAIGIGTMSGFNFKENFDEPYSSRNISEFWRRWHISLSSWFKDYVYIPLGGNRVSNIRWALNIMAVWILTGIWHGSTLNFVVWGLYFGLILIIEKKWLNNFIQKHKFLSHFYTLLILLVGWIIFKENNLIDVLYYGFAMIDLRSFGSLKDLINTGILQNIGYLLIGIIFLFPNFKNKIMAFIKSRSLFYSVLCILLLIISIIFIENGSYTTFLYFKF